LKAKLKVTAQIYCYCKSCYWSCWGEAVIM
jgi:hypothetical protein